MAIARAYMRDAQPTAALVQAYEARHVPIDPPDPVE
jgi:hypothetical protein